MRRSPCLTGGRLWPGLIAAVALCGCFQTSGSDGSGDGGTGSADGGGPAYRYTVVPLQTVGFRMTQAPVVGQSFVLQLPAAGGTPPYAWSLVSGAYPAGLSLSADGRVSGTPTEAGYFEQVLRLTDATGDSVTASYDMTMASNGSLDLVLIAPVIPAFGQDRQVGFIPAVQGPGGSLPWTFTITGLPDGVTYDPASGLISGVPTSAGTSQLTMSLQDRDGNEAIGSPASPTFQVNAPVLVDPETSGYDGTYDWFLGPVGGITSTCSGCVFITNGVLSNNEGSFSNSSIDHFGNLTFNGPCPNGSPVVGTYTGTLGGLSRPQWQGTWSCADGAEGGPDSPWKIFNQH